jgi:AhpD family alkylhydroperoxidase
MQPRMKNPAVSVPGALDALQGLGAAIGNTGVPKTTLSLIEARASQINGCSVCLDMHTRELKATGEPDARVFMVGAWREAPYFNEAERAALALTEAATRLADRSDAVPDDVWEEAAKHYDETQLAGCWRSRRSTPSTASTPSLARSRASGSDNGSTSRSGCGSPPDAEPSCTRYRHGGEQK